MILCHPEMSARSNRCRNIAAALDNLLTQLGPNAEGEAFTIRLQTAKEIYQHEMIAHMKDDAGDLFSRR